MIRRKIYVAITMIIMLSIVPVGAVAATVNLPYSGGSLTVTYPDSYSSCSPSDSISISGVTSGHPITIYFQYLDATTGWVVTLGSIVTDVDGSWPFPYPDVGGTMTFNIAIRDNYINKQIKGYKWTINCEPPTGGQGCTPGYWRNHVEDWPPTGYSPADIFDTVFGTSYFSSSYTLYNAIWQGGGGINRLARHGTAALLSAAHPDVAYPYTVAEVIAWIQAGVVDPLAQANELGCSIP